MIRALATVLGGWTLRAVQATGDATILAAETARCAVRRPMPLAPLIDQMDVLGARSVTITVITALFTGMVLALQSAYALSRFGAEAYIGMIVGISVVREMGPVLTALVVGGRVASGIAAELGAMTVTEQIDAMRAMGANPVKHLVVPRVLACMLVLPLLTILADALGILGGAVITVLEVHGSFFLYLNSITASVVVADILHGLFKSVVFGFLIGLTGDYMGLTTTQGTEGVGRATTRAVVVSFILILVADFFLSKLFLAL